MVTSKRQQPSSAHRGGAAGAAALAAGTAAAPPPALPVARGRSLQGSSIITGEDIEDYRAVPPMSLVLSPTPSRLTEVDVDIVREAVRRTVLDGLRAEAGAGAGGVDMDVDVSFDLGEVVELTFVADGGDGRGGSKLRRRNLASSAASVTNGAATSTSAGRIAQVAYTVVGFEESKVTYRAPLLSDFTPPSQTTFEEETWVAVSDDAAANIPDAIRAAVVASVGGGGSGALAGVQGATADLTYEPPSSGAADNELKQEQSESVPDLEPKPEHVDEEPEPESLQEPQPGPVEETPKEEKVEQILPVDEEVDQPPPDAVAGEEESDGGTLTEPPPAEEEKTAFFQEEQTNEREVGTAPVQEKEVDGNTELDTAPTESQTPSVVDEPQEEQGENEGGEQEPKGEQEDALPMPTPPEGNEEDVADNPATDDKNQDSTSSPKDSVIPPPLFGGGDYTGEASVSSVGIAEESADSTVSGDGATGAEGSAIGVIVGGCMAALLAVLLIAAMLVKRRGRRSALGVGAKRTKLRGDVKDRGELSAENTFELDESGELVLNGMQVEPADGNRSNDAGLLRKVGDEDSDEEKVDGSGYLPTGLFGSFVGVNRSASHKATPRKSPKAVAASGDKEDADEDSILTDWSNAPSVNSLGHSVQGSVADDEPTSVASDLAKTYDLSKSRSGGANILLQFKKKKEHKRSKSMELTGHQPNVRTEEDFERHRNAASISLRKDMMCTVDSMSAYPMHGRSRSADHGLLASGTSLGTSPEAPEAGWIWGSRNEADMKLKIGGGQELEML